ncbi:hypothetical protein ACNKHT_27870 [Shigella flexneri]
MPGVTDKGYYTNSFHLDVEKKVNRVRQESTLKRLTRRWRTVVSFARRVSKHSAQHLKALEDVSDYSYQHVPYTAPIHRLMSATRWLYR